jgi:nicotinamidase/pyrazinamidase
MSDEARDVADIPAQADNRALVVVDVQPTFCEGGELPVAGGNATADRIAAYLADAADNYRLIVTTQDWHIEPGSHFSTTPDFVDTWPPHGIAGTPNAELHPAIAKAISALPRVVSLRKGAYQAAYSGFEATDDAGHDLAWHLAANDIREVDICGIAESHCVKATALDGARLGYRVTVLTDLTVPVTPELGEQARSEMLAAGVRLRRAA